MPASGAGGRALAAHECGRDNHTVWGHSARTSSARGRTEPQPGRLCSPTKPTASLRLGFLGLSLLATLMFSTSRVPAAAWDNYSDTWVATDALGRTVPTYPAVPAPRPDRTVGIFYFLWLGEHIQGGPFDVTKILAADPQAMHRPDSPLWGPLHAPHHWGESLFGYYLTNDEGVLRKHAQMLSDAGVDVVIFDVTNQITYRDWYRALLRVWAEMRRQGNRTPQVAFLTPFWSPSKVVHELWRDLYQPELHPELWFRWEGKPLILADPELIFVGEENAHQDAPAEIQSGHALGQSFTTDRALQTVSARFATWHTTTGAVTLTLRSNNPAGAVIATERFQNVRDNSWLRLKLRQAAPAGAYSSRLQSLWATSAGGATRRTSFHAEAPLPTARRWLAIGRCVLRSPMPKRRRSSGSSLFARRNRTISRVRPNQTCGAGSRFIRSMCSPMPPGRRNRCPSASRRMP